MLHLLVAGDVASCNTARVSSVLLDRKDRGPTVAETTSSGPDDHVASRDAGVHPPWPGGGRAQPCPAVGLRQPHLQSPQSRNRGPEHGRTGARCSDERSLDPFAHAEPDQDAQGRVGAHPAPRTHGQAAAQAHAKRRRHRPSRRAREPKPRPKSTPKPKPTPEPEPEPKAKPKPKSSSGKRVVYLTFDDGPSRYTQQVLDILNRYEAKATFFVLGANVVDNPSLVRAAARDGMSIQNHTWDHPDLTTRSNDEIRSQIRRTDNAIRDAGGGNSTCVRPPYGATNSGCDPCWGTWASGSCCGASTPPTISGRAHRRSTGAWWTRSAGGRSCWLTTGAGSAPRPWRRSPDPRQPQGAGLPLRHPVSLSWPTSRPSRSSNAPNRDGLLLATGTRQSTTSRSTFPTAPSSTPTWAAAASASG